ncbi:MAG: Arm DNA-binding domain-containing protein, partial [Alphaproteobacteria bacterium]|nr:Arm DNA-binding domain-containing protein [Alphaproteobacteria bacterium]
MADKWTDRTIRAISRPGMHRDPESRIKLEKGALYLGVKEGGAKSWYFRFQLNGRRRKMGLGRYPSVGLSLARDRAK